MDDIREQKCMISVMALTSPKSRCQQEYIPSKTCRVFYTAWIAKIRCHRLGGLTTENYSPQVWRLQSKLKFCAKPVSGERGIGHCVMGAFWPWPLHADLFRGTGSKGFPSTSQLTFCEMCVFRVHSHTRECALQWSPQFWGHGEALVSGLLGTWPESRS